MFTSQPSPPSVCLHKALLTSSGGCYTGGGTSRFLKNTRMPQEHVQHTHGRTGLAVTGTSGVFSRLPELFLELLPHHSWDTQQAA